MEDLDSIIQDAEVEVERERENMRLWSDRYENQECTYKAFHEVKTEIEDRLNTLGDIIWKACKVIRECYANQGLVPRLSPDYMGPSHAVLKVLHKNPYGKWKDKRAAGERREFKYLAMDMYDSVMSPVRIHGGQPLWCPILDKHIDRMFVKAAHIVPYQIPVEIAEYMFGEGSGARIETADNAMVMLSSLQTWFDKQQFVIIPVDQNEWPITRWKTTFVREDLGNPLLWGDATLEDLEGRELTWKTAHRPAARFLYFHFVYALMHCEANKFPGYEKDRTLLRDHASGKWARGVRKSVLQSMAKHMGHLSEDYDWLLSGEDQALWGDDVLSHREINEVGRRVCDAMAKNAEKAEQDREDRSLWGYRVEDTISDDDYRAPEIEDDVSEDEDE